MRHASQKQLTMLIVKFLTSEVMSAGQMAVNSVTAST